MNDGFEIARQDLLIRGPGEFLGARQSGAPLLRFAGLERDVALIEQARDDADELLRKEPAAAAARLPGGSAESRSSSRLETPSQSWSFLTEIKQDQRNQ